MKKLLIAAAIVCAAMMSQAAACAWNSGYLYKAKSTTDGTFTATKFTTAGVVNCVVWEIASSTAFDSLNDGDLFNSYKAGTTGSLVTGAQVYTAANNAGSMIMKTGTKTYDTGTPVYAAILYTYTEGGVDYYMENFATIDAKSGTATVADLAIYQGGKIGTAPQGDALTKWTVASVPEPTSGLLLLLGVAGMALRRRRA